MQLYIKVRWLALALYLYFIQTLSGAKQNFNFEQTDTIL